MSSAPKGLLEEGGHSATLKKSLEENRSFSFLSGKPVARECPLPFECSLDWQIAKLQRYDIRDVDKRPFLLPVHRISSSANVTCLDHSGASDNRTGQWDFKDHGDAKTEARETKVEFRELNTEPGLDALGSKIDGARPQSREDDKEIRSEKESQLDLKGEVNSECNCDSKANSHLNDRHPKEHIIANGCSESSGDGIDPLHTTVQHNLSHNKKIVTKDVPNGEEQQSLELHKVVEENKMQLVGDEKIKEKESERKDEKHRDWGERDKDRNDCQNNLQQGGQSKDLSRQERETERRQRERKDSQKDKEHRDRAKDSVEKEFLDITQKGNLRCGKEPTNGTIKTFEQENATLEQMRPREFDSWTSGDRDYKVKKRERDQEVEADRPDKRNKGHDKGSDDGCLEGHGVTERAREVFGYGIQQRRRVLRSRGSLQASQCEPRKRSRSREDEGSQGQVEISSIVYKVGECMQELLKSWKDFIATQKDKKDGKLQRGPCLEICIAAEHVTATNRQVKGAQLWGTDIYTNDSDLVAVLMHTGYCCPTSPLPTAIHELRATIQVLPPQDCYTSTLRNNIRSRAWGVGIRCSFCVERCCIVKKGGETIYLEPCLTHISAVEPTLAPVSIEHTMTTRAAALNALKQQRFVHEVTIQYNLCNEPWTKYSMGIVADKGPTKPLYTSARLKKGEVLYLETDFSRYELCFNREKTVSHGTAATVSQAPESDKKSHHHNLHFCIGDRNHNRDNIIDVFRWSRCKKPLPQKLMRTFGVPLPIEHLEVLEEMLEWEDLQWSQTGVCIAGKVYVLARAHFLSPH